MADHVVPEPTDEERLVLGDLFHRLMIDTIGDGAGVRGGGYLDTRHGSLSIDSGVTLVEADLPVLARLYGVEEA